MLFVGTSTYTDLENALDSLNTMGTYSFTDANDASVTMSDVISGGDTLRITFTSLLGDLPMITTNAPAVTAISEFVSG